MTATKLKDFQSVAATSSIIDTYYDKVAVIAIRDEIKDELYKLADKLVDEIMDQMEVVKVFQSRVDVEGKRKLLITMQLDQKEKK